MKMITLCGVTAALAMFSAPAFAADIVFCAGHAGGGYDGIMQKVAAELNSRGNTATVVNMGGSEDILNGLADGKCNYGMAQKDIFWDMTKDNPAVVSKVVPLQALYNEAMTLICSKDSGYDELSDIQKGDTIIVDVIGSGSALTWDNMVAIEKEYGNGSSWSEAIPSNTPLDEASGPLSLGQAKCAFGVGKVPIQWAKDLEESGYTVSWIYDKDINDLEFNGASLYEPVRVYAGDTAYGSKFDTYKVPAVLFRGAGKPDDAVDKLVKRIAPALGRKVNTVE